MKKILAALCLVLTMTSCTLEPYNGCLLYAVKKQAAVNSGAEVSAQKYVGPLVSTHLLAIEFNDGGHVALVIKGQSGNFYAWDDSPHGGRELFFKNKPVKLYNGYPSPIEAAEACFPEKKVELAWWMDEKP